MGRSSFVPGGSVEGTYKALLEEQFLIAYHSKGITWSCVDAMARVERVQVAHLLKDMLQKKQAAIDKANKGR